MIKKLERYLEITDRRIKINNTIFNNQFIVKGYIGSGWNGSVFF